MALIMSGCCCEKSDGEIENKSKDSWNINLTQAVLYEGVAGQVAYFARPSVPLLSPVLAGLS
jgi:hypothetical protein